MKAPNGLNLDKLDARDAGQIQACLLFSEFSTEQFEQLLEGSVVINLGNGEQLFELGQAVTGFFFLHSGQIKLSRMSADGNEKVIDIIAPGQSFAEAAMFLRKKGYPVTAHSVGDSRVYGFDKDCYLDALHQSTDACFSLLGRLSQRLHWQIGEIDRLTLHSATYRLVNYLLEQLPEQVTSYTEVRLTAPKHVIASRLSIKPETLSRILHRLADHGLIRVESSHIELTDIDRVREYAELEPG